MAESQAPSRPAPVEESLDQAFHDLQIIMARLRKALRPLDDFDHQLMIYLLEMASLQLCVLLKKHEAIDVGPRLWRLS